MIDQPSPKYRSARTVILPRQSWVIARHYALAAALLCWAGCALVCALVLGGGADWLDEIGLLFWRDGPLLLPRGPIWLLEAVRDLTALGGVLLRNLFVLGSAVALVYLRKRREAWLLVGTVVSGWVVEGALKLAVGRERPTIVPHLTEAGGASFPSGHAFNSALVYLALAMAFATLTPRPSARWLLMGAAAALSALIALSRVWLGVHFPSDVLAGWLGGAAWAFTATVLLDRPATAAALTAKREPGV